MFIYLWSRETGRWQAHGGVLGRKRANFSNSGAQHGASGSKGFDGEEGRGVAGRGWAEGGRDLTALIQW
jgi:hypothetical protein